MIHFFDDSMYTLTKSVRTTHGPDGAVVLDIQHGRVLRLNATGSLILKYLERGETESHICERLTQHFRVSRDVAHEDVREFLASMERAGLVTGDTPEILL